MLYFYSTEQDTSNASFYKGKLFEQLLKEYLEAAAYCVELRAKRASLEYDIVGHHAVDGRAVVGEAKAHASTISGQDVAAFIGKAIPFFHGEKPCSALFLSVSALTPEALDFLTGIQQTTPYQIATKCGSMLEQHIRELLKFPSVDQVSALTRSFIPVETGQNLLHTNRGTYIAVTGCSQEAAFDDRFALISAAGTLVTDTALLTLINQNVEAFQELKPASVDNTNPINISDSSNINTHSVVAIPDKQRLPCEGATIDHLDHSLLRSYAEKYLGVTDVSLEDIFQKLDLFFSESDTRPNEAAILCFGLRPERFYPNAASVFAAGDLASDTLERAPIEGPLVKQFQMFVQLTLKNLSQVAVFGNSALRSDEYEIPAKVLREVIMNALAHRDFEAPGRVQVHVAAAYIEVSNPGSFPEGFSWEYLLAHPGKSLTPNRRIANYLQRLAGYEGLGRGFAVLQKYREERGNDAFRFEQHGNRVSVYLARNPQPIMGPVVNASEMDSKLRNYLKQRTHGLAQTADMFGKRITNVFVERSFQDTGGGTGKLCNLDQLLRVPGKRLLLTGGPGSGKSWYLIRLALGLAGYESDRIVDRPVDDPVPIYVSLRRVRPDLPLISAISEASGIEAGTMEYALLKRRTVLLLDGLDEVADQGKGIILDFIEALHSTYSNVTTITSVRANVQSLPAIRFDHHFLLTELSVEEIDAFLDAYGASRKRKSLAALLHSERGAVFKSPVLLSTLAQVFGVKGSAPDDEDSLLDAVVQILLNRHDAAKSGFKRETVLEPREMHRLIKVLALMMVATDMDSISHDALEALIERSLQLAVTENYKGKAGSVAKDLIHLGLLMENSAGGWSFPHRVLKEHLAVGAASTFPFLDLEFIAQLVLSVVRARQNAIFASKIATSWIQSGEQGAALCDKLKTLASRENQGTVAAISGVIQALTIQCDSLCRRDNNLFKMLTGRDFE